jgi:hypothetical protein
VRPRSVATCTFYSQISIKAVGDQGATPPGALIPRTCHVILSSPLGRNVVLACSAGQRPSA